MDKMKELKVGSTFFNPVYPAHLFEISSVSQRLRGKLFALMFYQLDSRTPRIKSRQRDRQAAGNILQPE